MKKLLTMATLSVLATSAMAIQPGLQPPTTEGITNGSTAEVRITANVVDGVAVNEASPIDFGNLARGMHTGVVNQMTPGKIHIKGASTANSKVNVKLNTATTTLAWMGANGTDQAGEADKTKTTITDVKIGGLTTSDEEMNLAAAGGEITRVLTASFEAGKGDDQNLGGKQKLGSYMGSILVTAIKA